MVSSYDPTHKGEGFQFDIDVNLPDQSFGANQKRFATWTIALLLR